MSTYKLKHDPRDNLNRNWNMYTPGMIAEMKEDMRDFLHYFGYCNHPAEGLTDERTCFFNYETGERDRPELESLYR